MEHKESNEENIFILDMDGVLVDSVTELYTLHLAFLESLGKKATLEECEQLDGSNLKEIVEYIITKHHLPVTGEELITRYTQHISGVYTRAHLMDGVKPILNLLREHKFKICLATAAKKINVDMILKRFNLSEYFEYIITGDDVKEAKPSPEIYLRVKNNFEKKKNDISYRYYVLEDSPHGVAAARNAGMKVIFFNARKRKITIDADYTVQTMNEVKEIIPELKTGCKKICSFQTVELISATKNELFSAETESLVRNYWEIERLKNKALFNGMMVTYKNHRVDEAEKKMSVTYSPVEYKYFYTQQRQGINLGIKPLAVSGIIIDSKGNLILSKRSGNVTEYPHYYEFVPSGGIRMDSEGIISIERQIKEEFQEETNLNSQGIKSITPFCFVFDSHHSVYDICCVILWKGDLRGLKENLNTEEYHDSQIINIHDSQGINSFLKSERLAPTSLILFHALQDLLLSQRFKLES